MRQWLELTAEYAVPDLARFRVNAFRQRGSVSIVARLIPFTVKTETAGGRRRPHRHFDERSPERR